MLLKVFSVYDVKAAAYGQPFFMPTSGGAIRSFGDTCLDQNSMLNKHPEDYSLHEIGEFDDVTGRIEGQPSEPIATAAQFVNGGVS